MDAEIKKLTNELNDLRMERLEDAIDYLEDTICDLRNNTSINAIVKRIRVIQGDLMFLRDNLYKN